MQPYDKHITDRELLLEADGEVGASRAAQIRDHLAGCWSCRTRRAELEQTISDFVQVQQRELNGRVPPVERSRGVFRAALAQAAATPLPRQWWPQQRLAWAGGVGVLLVVLGGLLVWFAAGRAIHPSPGEFAPNAAWTPGYVRPVSMQAVCSTVDRAESRPVVSASVAQAVFSRYGIRDPRPRSYEVDYLIPPSLGGSDDPRNLWPQPYSTGVWNARVKDALEDRLRSLVCGGKLDLAVAQRDLTRDWISAYKKYFRTDRPLIEHAAFVKDRPWE